MKWIFSKWILDSLFSGILDSKSWILDSRAQYSGFHKQKFPGFRNPDYLTWSDFFTLFVRFILGFPFLLNRFLGEQIHWLFKCHCSHKPRTNNLFHSGSLSCLLLVIIIPSRFSWQFQLKNGGQVSFIFQITRNPRNPWLKCFLYHESSVIALFTNRLSKQLINSSKLIMFKSLISDNVSPYWQR